MKNKKMLLIALMFAIAPCISFAARSGVEWTQQAPKVKKIKVAKPSEGNGATFQKFAGKTFRGASRLRLGWHRYYTPGRTAPQWAVRGAVKQERSR